MRPIEPMLNHRVSSQSKAFIHQFLLMAFCCWCQAAAFGQGVSVLTFHNDFARTGQNTNETILTPANVNTNTFGQLFSYVVDGDIYAEPLYVPGLVIPGQGAHNVVFVATQYNNVYAFDADSNLGSAKGLLWNVNLGSYAATPNNDFGNRYGPYHDIDPSVGITGTPVIDPASGTLYVDSFTHEGASYVHKIHALNITNGMEQPHSPAVVSASVPGVGVDSSGGVLNFNAQRCLQRPALTLAGGRLYVAYTGFADTDPYHGWVIGFDPGTLEHPTNTVFVTTPNSTVAAYGANAGEGGIWMSGNGLAVDANGNLFFEVGNGVFNAGIKAGGTEYGDSFMKLSTTNGLAVADYFTPYNQQSLADGDTDVGSGGLMLLPDSAGSAAHPHLLVGCGKEGKIYLLDRDNLGHYNAASDSQIVQELPGAVGGVWSSGAWFNNYIYYLGSGDVLKAFKLVNGKLVATPSSRSKTAFSASATPAISANGTNDAIAWVLQTDSPGSGPSVLHAYNAYNVAQELYNSGQAGTRDNAGLAVKFTVPTVVNGKVYVGARNSLAVYGNGAFISPPTISPAGGVFTNSVSIRLANSATGAVIYYTMDNANPTTNSPVYTGPFVLTNTAAVKAMAAEPGTVPSMLATATFVNNTSLTLTTGVLKQEFYSGATRANIESAAYSTPPAFTHSITSFETPSGQGDNYAERVSGLFIPAQTGSYVFFVCSDDDSDLFLSTDATPAHKYLIARETAWSNSREWVSSGGGSTISSKRSDQFNAITWPGGHTIQLTAGTQYYIEGDHAQGNGGDDFAVTFKLVGTADPVDGDAPNISAGLIASYSYNNVAITFANSPQNGVAIQGGVATFNAGAYSGYLGDTSGAPGPAIQYQWQSAAPGSTAFTNIPNATGNSYTTPPLMLEADGMQFRAALTAGSTSANSAVATLNVVPDTTPPAPVEIVSVNFSATVLTMAFSKPLESVSAQTAQNYSLSPVNQALTNAALDVSGTNVTLTAGGALPTGTPITLGISGVKDLAGTPVAPNTSITFSLAEPAPGQVTVTNGAITPGALKFTSITSVSGQAVVQWSGSAVLEEATNLTGPWTASSNQGNPQILPISGTKFYRLRQ